MKYNRSEIMKAAWKKFNRFGLTFAQALRMAWYDAKKAAARYDVYGVRFDGSRDLIASGVGFNRAGELQWMNQYRYEAVSVTATGSVGRAPQSKGSGKQAA